MATQPSIPASASGKPPSPPADTPRAVRDRLQAAVREAVNLPETKRRFQDLGYVGITDTPEAFATFLHEDIAHMAQLIKQYNLKPE